MQTRVRATKIVWFSSLWTWTNRWSRSLLTINSGQLNGQPQSPWPRRSFSFSLLN